MEIKKIILLTFLLIGHFFYCQSIDVWWFREPQNMVFEQHCDIILSDINQSSLKNEIVKFMKTYGLDSDENKAVIVDVLSLDFVKNQYEYRISYLSDYYTLADESNEIQGISKIDTSLIFFKNHFTSYFSINKNYLFGLLRRNYPKLTESLNYDYIEYLKGDEKIIPVVLGNTEHQIPNWYLTIKDNILINKVIEIDC